MTPAASVGIVPMTNDRLDSAGQVFASSHADYPASCASGTCSRL
jgi:hypothetical protein